MSVFFRNVVLCTLVIGLGAVIATVAVSVRSKTSEAHVDLQELKPKVEVTVLEPGLVEDRLLLTGTVEAWESRILSAEIAGRIELQAVEEGDQVAAEATLIKINTKDVRARLDQARAQSNLSSQELARMEAMRKSGISSPQDLDRAQADSEVASANLRMRQIEVDKSTIVAEFDGIVDRVLQEEGEYVSEGTPLVQLVQVHKVKVVFGIPERDIVRFKEGDPVEIKVDALPDTEFEGRIHRIATSAESSTLTFRTEVVVDNAEGKLRPGMIARATFIREAFQEAITVPMFTIISLEDGHFVFVERDGVAHMQPVSLGFYQSNHVLIASGLTRGDRLISVGQRDLREGELVEVVKVR